MNIIEDNDKKDTMEEHYEEEHYDQEHLNTKTYNDPGTSGTQYPIFKQAISPSSGSPNSLQLLHLLGVGLVGPLGELVGSLSPAGHLSLQRGGLALQNVNTTLLVAVLLLGAGEEPLRSAYGGGTEHRVSRR